MMKLGLVTAILPDLNLDQVLAFAAAERFACVEAMCWPVGKAERRFAGVTHLDVAGFTQTRADDVNAQCVKHCVNLSGLGYYPNPLDPDPAAARRQVDHLKKVIRAAPKLGLKNVNTFVGRDWTKTIDENWPRFLKTWKPIIALAEDCGVKIGIENCPMSFTRDEWPGGKNLAVSPMIWRRMFSDIPSKNFGLNYDPSHFVLQRMDPLSPLAEFKDKLFHLHAKDLTVHPDKLNEVGIFAFPREWHTPRIPGFGEVNWAQFMAKLYEIRYDGPVCIEVEDDTFGRTLNGRKQAVRVAGNILRPFFGRTCCELTDSQIDGAVLAVARPMWQKVAMMISKAADGLGGNLRRDDEGHHLISKRIKVLVRNGQLVSQGNLKKWRHSEVRLPGSTVEHPVASPRRSPR